MTLMPISHFSAKNVDINEEYLLQIDEVIEFVFILWTFCKVKSWCVYLE